MNMSNNFFSKGGKDLANKIKLRPALLNPTIRFEGVNEDIIENYYWHLNFAYYTGKGYKAIKLEDHHYFSENSQLGSNMRQVKGGSIRAFQENLNQMIQLIKVHLMPLLKEVKEAHFYTDWFNKVVDFDDLIQKELEKPKSSQNQEKLQKWRNERDQAINEIKDKWVSEVDRGVLWQMQKQATEGGLDFALLPTLFFGTKLDDPLQKTRSLSEQLEDYTYKIDVTEEALRALSRFQYRFYTWLPTAIRETQTTFKVKLASLKQFYAQFQMYINFMKPLLLEISKKTEHFEHGNFFRDFESENPDFVKLFDNSYSYIRILGVRGFEREGFIMDQLEFTKFGFFLSNSPKSNGIEFGKYKGKTGFIVGERDEKYQFKLFSGSLEEAKELSHSQFRELEQVEIDKSDLKLFPVMEFGFSQKRRLELLESQQGLQQVPFMSNRIDYAGYAWNLFEVACYREKIKVDDLQLLESFIGELGIIKDELLYYVNDLEGEPPWENDFKSSLKKSGELSSSKKEKSEMSSLFFGPIKGIGGLLSPLFPKISFAKNSSSLDEQTKKENKEEIVKLQIVEDTWKVYTIHKKVHGFIQW